MSLPHVADSHGLTPINDWWVTRSSQSDSLITRLCTECIEITKYCLRKGKRRSSVSIHSYRNLERTGSSFILWAEGHGVQEGALDEVFAKSWSLQQSVLRLLMSISKILSSSGSILCY